MFWKFYQKIKTCVFMQVFLWGSYIVYVYIAWKVSKYGVISGPYFPVFGLLRIQAEYRKIPTRNNSAFGHFSSKVSYHCWQHLKKKPKKGNQAKGKKNWAISFLIDSKTSTWGWSINLNNLLLQVILMAFLFMSLSKEFQVSLV